MVAAHPGQVRRAASLSLARIVARLGSGAVKNRPPGRARGAVTGPRRRHPVHVKRPKPGWGRHVSNVTARRVCR